MVNALLAKIFGTRHDRYIKRARPIVAAINALEPEMKTLSDSDFKEKTAQWREALKNEEVTLDELLPEAFALVREAAMRTLGQRHFDVQLIGGLVLHQGKISEMKTGEGKTLTSTLAIYLNALTSKGVHVVTVNGYLAKRDNEWMGQIYDFLGVTHGFIYPDMPEFERQEAYRADITYGTNAEFGFDYLRDNMKFSLRQFVQRKHYFAIVDEVDSILIDEARTPLIISGPAEEATDLYYQVDRLIPRLQANSDYEIDEKKRAVYLNESGVEKAERFLAVENLYDPANIKYLHHIEQALKAHALFKRDTDYVVKEGEVLIVDEFTGRLMPGRRYSDGLHQALEAKEHVKIANENQTLATITLQNYFRMYEKLSGMTGTAETEAHEFEHIYKLDVVVVPTNQPMIREDNGDVIYKTAAEKFRNVVREIEDCYQRKQPVLVGTISIEKSELLSKILKQKGIPHNVLNAKNHEREAEIVSQAGQAGAVTIATNMAGRGTDIQLGMGVKEVGGLHILGTERHESRRIDNQLRGRSGRQGDPGSSRFYLSLEDDLLRIFGGDRIKSIMDRFGVEEDMPIEHRMVTRGIANAQKKVEEQNFGIRKHLLEYDDVMNKQREVVYEQRAKCLEQGEIREIIDEVMEEVAGGYADTFAPPKVYPEEWDWEELSNDLKTNFGVEFHVEEEERVKYKRDLLEEEVLTALKNFYDQKESVLGSELMREAERIFMLRNLDEKWKDHLLNMDHLKEGIGLRGYGQRDPLVEYKREAFELFGDMVLRVKEDTLKMLFLFVPVSEEQLQREEAARREKARKMTFSGPSDSDGGGKKAPKRVENKIGRNELCPCGSGKKYKKCCMLKEEGAAVG